MRETQAFGNRWFVAAVERAISEVTRRNIADALRVDEINWAGRLTEPEFLSRLYDLDALPSTDHRFRGAAADIWQHRVNNPDDWPIDWVFADSRFDLTDGPDETFLRFLCEMVHPVVQPDEQVAQSLVTTFNTHLAADGWEIVKGREISGKPVFVARLVLLGEGLGARQVKAVAEKIDAGYAHRQATRMEQAVESDPELAIGTAKEFVETICRTILFDRKVACGKADSLTDLVKKTTKELKLAPDDIPDSAKAAETIRILLNNLAMVAKGLTELRNPYGTGHGKHAQARGLQPRHARLAAGAATCLGVFLFDTHGERGQDKVGNT